MGNLKRRITFRSVKFGIKIANLGYMYSKHQCFYIRVTYEQSRENRDSSEAMRLGADAPPRLSSSWSALIVAQAYHTRSPPTIRLYTTKLLEVVWQSAPVRTEARTLSVFSPSYPRLTNALSRPSPARAQRATAAAPQVPRLSLLRARKNLEVARPRTARVD